MRLRLAKKVHLGRSCSGANCHRWSTIDAASRKVWRAWTRKVKPRTYLPPWVRESVKLWGIPDFVIGSRLLSWCCASDLTAGVTIDYDGPIGFGRPGWTDPHDTFAAV